MNAHKQGARSIRRVFAATIVLLAGGLILLWQPSSAAENKKGKPAIPTINAQQRDFLASAKAWKVQVTHNYPHDEKENMPIPIREDCERLLQRAGWKVDASNATIILRITVTGKADWASYNATPSQRYSGAEVTIDAAITTVANSTLKTILTFSPVKGTRGTPWSIGGGYRTPAEAPYDEAYRQCEGFYAQFLSLIHTVKGARAVYECSHVLTYAEYQKEFYAFVQTSGDREFVPLLVGDLLNGKDSLESIAVCLGELGDARAVEPLCMSLVDKQGDAWAPAALALAKLGDPKAIPHLRTALLGAHSNAKPVADALRALQWAPTTPKEAVIYWLALDESLRVKQLKDEAVPTLIELLAAEKDAAPSAAQLLGQMKAATAVAPLSRTLLNVKSSNAWEGRARRSAAAKALSEIGGPKVIEPLAMALMSDEDNDVRKACAAGLGEAEGEMAFKSLMQALAADRDGGVRTTCATALGKRGNAAAVGSLAKTVMEDKADYVVMAAQDALGQLKDREGTDCLLKSLNHKNSSIRTHAVQALKLIGDSKAAPAIGDRLKEETDPQTRQAMVELLAGLDVQPATLPFEAHLILLAKNRKWEDIRDLLNDQSTDKVIEALKLEEELVNTAFDVQ